MHAPFIGALQKAVQDLIATISCCVSWSQQKYFTLRVSECRKILPGVCKVWTRCEPH